jgi:hypothetical protein
MRPTYARLPLSGAGAALLPFVVVAFFTWLRDGRALGAVALAGHGELLPASALLAAQALTIHLGVPAPLRAPPSPLEVAMCWLLLTGASGGYVVPHSGATGFEQRMAIASLVAFGLGVVCRLLAARLEPLGGAP